MGLDYLNLFVEWDVPSSHPIQILDAGDVIIRILGWWWDGPILTNGIVSHLDVSWDVPLESKSLLINNRV